MSLESSPAVSRAVLRSDYFRRAPGPDSTREHREWLHFCVRASTVDVLVNFSLIDGPRVAGDLADERGYVTALVHDGAWSGGIVGFEPADLDVSRGRIDASFGPNRLRFEDGCFHVSTRSTDPEVTVDLVLSPEVLPALAHNVPMPGGARTSWLALPRLRASGLVQVGGRVHVVDAAPAYHDHNWGYEVGGDCAWQWGYLTPDDPASPWSCVFVRIGDRMRAATWMQGLFLWRGQNPLVGFRGREVTAREEGLLRQDRIPKFPAAAALISPGSCADVPRTLVVTGGTRSDHLEYRFESSDIAQVVLPEGDGRPTVINEVRGTACIRGVVAGERVEAKGPVFAEFVEVRP